MMGERMSSDELDRDFRFWLYWSPNWPSKNVDIVVDNWAIASA